MVTAGLSLAVAALALLPLWVIVWGDVAVVDVLTSWLSRLSVGTPVIAAVFAVFGEFHCAGGVLIIAGLFGILVAAVNIAGRIVRRRWARRGRG
jgi:hypothetical protein